MKTSLGLLFFLSIYNYGMEHPKPALVPSFVKPDSKKIKKRAQLLHILDNLLEQNQDLYAPVIEGQSLLQESCSSDAYLDVTQRLLFSYNINPNRYIIGTNPPLYVACHHLAVKTVDLLLKAQAYTNRYSHCFTSPLLIICDPQQDTIIQKKVARRLAIAQALITHAANPRERSAMDITCFDSLATNPLKLFDAGALTSEEKKLLSNQRVKLLQIIKKSKSVS